MKRIKKDIKYIFVFGGVLSGLGKGIVASSLGYLLKSCGHKVTIQKLDPYLNVDPGTMNPYQHGEVFVLNDGSETDLDLGHYERFIDVDLNRIKTNSKTLNTILHAFGFLKFPAPAIQYANGNILFHRIYY